MARERVFVSCSFFCSGERASKVVCFIAIFTVIALSSDQSHEGELGQVSLPSEKFKSFFPYRRRNYAGRKSKMYKGLSDPDPTEVAYVRSLERIRAPYKSYRQYVHTLARVGKITEAVWLIGYMSHRKIYPSISCYLSILHACDRTGDSEFPTLLLSHLFRSKYTPPARAYSLAISSLSRSRNWHRAIELYETDVFPRVQGPTILNSVLRACDKGGLWKKAIEILALASETRGGGDASVFEHGVKSVRLERALVYIPPSIPMDNNPDAANRAVALFSSPDNPSVSKLEFVSVGKSRDFRGGTTQPTLGEEMEMLVKFLSLQECERRARFDLFKVIKMACFDAGGHTCKLFGSFKANFSTFYSDVDIIVSRKSSDLDDKSILLDIAKQIKRKPRYEVFSLREHAAIPILVVRDVITGVWADVSIAFNDLQDTTPCLIYLTRRYPRYFRPLVTTLKTILTQYGLSTTFHGGLGSFKLYLLVGRFLASLFPPPPLSPPPLPFTPPLPHPGGCGNDARWEERIPGITAGIPGIRGGIPGNRGGAFRIPGIRRRIPGFEGRVRADVVGDVDVLAGFGFCDRTLDLLQQAAVHICLSLPWPHYIAHRCVSPAHARPSAPKEPGRAARQRLWTRAKADETGCARGGQEARGGSVASSRVLK
ncbi:hypothetical protein AAMO2058_000411100 [Amorphochlora amoebiformis]